MAGIYELQNLIGTGTFGEAWIARNRKDNSKCVVKIVKILKLSERELDQALTEVSVLARCNHINIIKYLDAFVDEGSLKIAMEYADGGDLHKRIVGQKGIHFGKEAILDWVVQISFGLKYIHSQNILHRDLKTQNIFLTAQNVVKIGDFGIARVLRDSYDVAMTTIGTPFYLSPEICQKKPYNYKSDMWALGCVLYEMCTLHVPFNAKDFDSLVMKIMTGQFEPLPSHFGTTIRYLCTRLLDKDPDKRLSANEVLNFSPLKTFVQRYEPLVKRKIPQLALRRYSGNNENKSLRRKSTGAEGKNIRKELNSSVQVVGSIMRAKPDVSVRKGSNPLRSIQPKVERKPSSKGDCPSPKKKGIDWMSDKENIDPRRLIGNKTYQVKNPKFRRFSSGTPRIKRIVSQQRSSVSSEEQKQHQQVKDECVRSVLYRNIERQSKKSSATSVGSVKKVNDVGSQDSIIDDDEVFCDASIVLASLEESLQTVIDKSQGDEKGPISSIDRGHKFSKENGKVPNDKGRRVSIENSMKPPIDYNRRRSRENSHRSSIDSFKSSVDEIGNSACSEHRRVSIEKNRRESVENIRRTSVDNNQKGYKGKGRRASLENNQRIEIDNKPKTAVKLSRKPTVEKTYRKVSVSDGCLYVPGDEKMKKDQNCSRRSSSCDQINDKGTGGLVKKAGSETYLIKRTDPDGSMSGAEKLQSQNTGADREMIRYINKALYLSLQDYLQSPNTAKIKTYQRLIDIFGKEKMEEILEICRECVYNQENYDSLYAMLSETDVLCVPLIFQYLQLEGSQ